jgi:hypothetical protein
LAASRETLIASPDIGTALLDELSMGLTRRLCRCMLSSEAAPPIFRDVVRHVTWTGARTGSRPVLFQDLGVPASAEQLGHHDEKQIVYCRTAYFLPFFFLLAPERRVFSFSGCSA